MAPGFRWKIAHVESVSSFDVSLDTQEVLVRGTIPYDDALEVIKKTGKEVGVDRTLGKFLLITLFLGSLRGGRQLAEDTNLSVTSIERDYPKFSLCSRM